MGTSPYQVHHLRHALVGAIARLEVEVRRPVVREVLAKRARRAGRLDGGVVLDRRHGGVEGVAADDLVDVRRLDHPWSHQGIQTLDDELRALEPHHGRRRELRDGGVWGGCEGQRQGLCLHVHLGLVAMGRV